MSDATNAQGRPANAIQVSNHIWAIPLTFSLPTASGAAVPRLVHAYIIRGVRESALVDCGTAACIPDVVAGINAAGLAPEQMSLLVATHEHADHMGAAQLLIRRYGWRVAAHTHARRWLEDAALQQRERPLLNFDTLMAGSITVDQPVNGGDEIELGGCRMRVLYTPGHSCGSQSLVVEPDGVIITGDVLISAVGAPFYDDPRAVRASVDSLRHALADDEARQLLSSHAPTPSLVTAQALDETLTLVQRMEAAVQQARSEVGDDAGDAFVRRALDLAGWTQQAIMPLTRITVHSHVAGSQ